MPTKRPFLRRLRKAKSAASIDSHGRIQNPEFHHQYVEDKDVVESRVRPKEPPYEAPPSNVQMDDSRGLESHFRETATGFAAHQARKVMDRYGESSKLVRKMVPYLCSKLNNPAIPSQESYSVEPLSQKSQGSVLRLQDENPQHYNYCHAPALEITVDGSGRLKLDTLCEALLAQPAETLTSNPNVGVSRQNEGAHNGTSTQQRHLKKPAEALRAAGDSQGPKKTFSFDAPSKSKSFLEQSRFDFEEDHQTADDSSTSRDSRDPSEPFTIDPGRLRTAREKQLAEQLFLISKSRSPIADIFQRVQPLDQFKLSDLTEESFENESANANAEDAETTARKQMEIKEAKRSADVMAKRTKRSYPYRHQLNNPKSMPSLRPQQTSMFED